MQQPITAIVAALLTLAKTSAALAHVTLATQKAPSGSTYKAVLRVGHGCNGSATTAIRVKIPEGVIVAKPMPKPGWDLTTKQGEYEQAYEYSGKTLTHSVTQIARTSGQLPDAWYDEFVFRVRLPDAPTGTTVYFPMVREGVDGVHRWISIPTGRARRRITTSRLPV